VLTFKGRNLIDEVFHWVLKGVAAELYGEGGMGVVSAVLEHSVAALQAPLSDYGEPAILCVLFFLTFNLTG
jgi:hypothetical protein